MKAAARAGVYVLIALACVPLLIVGVLAGLLLLLYALLEEIADSTAGAAPLAPHGETQARELARKVATRNEGH
jgi:uncharacterized iron-regulated membrane protein